MTNDSPALIHSTPDAFHTYIDCNTPGYVIWATSDGRSGADPTDGDLRTTLIDVLVRFGGTGRTAEIHVNGKVGTVTHSPTAVSWR